jgi:hypothetical protein
VEEPGVGVVEPREIGRVDARGLVGDTPFRDARQQSFDGRLQVDDEVGLRRIDGEPRGDLLVQIQLGRIEREPREQAVLLE